VERPGLKLFGQPIEKKGQKFGIASSGSLSRIYRHWRPGSIDPDYTKWWHTKTVGGSYYRFLVRLGNDHDAVAIAADDVFRNDPHATVPGVQKSGAGDGEIIPKLSVVRRKPAGQFLDRQPVANLWQIRRFQLQRQFRP